MTRYAFFDAPAGIAGDMCLGALLDAGWSIERLEEVVRALGLERIRVRAERVRRGALAATKVDVLFDGEPADDLGPPSSHLAEHGRTPAELEARLESARGMPARARERAVAVFRALAEAEARVHGVDPRTVHFHEVGAADALVDVLGTATALEDLGIEAVRVGPLPVGSGTVGTAHGLLPLPAPAVAHLLEGHPVFGSGEQSEQVTPTGAALVRVLASGHTWPGAFTIRAVGTGAGTREGGRLPNVLRVFLGDAASDAGPSDAVLLETNLDDATGQEVARAIDAALEAGALDAWATPATMKKGRPGVVLAVLAAPEDAPVLEAVLFRETPTLGVRRRLVARAVLPRRHRPVETPWGVVRMKIREGPDGTAATPEHDDALALAREHGVALRRVLDAARAAYDALD